MAVQSLHPYFSPEAVELLRRFIAENDGREIFCLGTLDEALRVVSLRVIARGNEVSVPAILEAAEHGSVAIHNHPSGNLTPSDNDVLLAGEFGAMGVGSFIVDNDVSRVHVLVEPFRRRDIHELDDGPILDLFRPEGALAARTADFEFRPQQLQMAADVIAAFNARRVAVIEAGTGVGKSLAYLVPAVHWALENKQKIVVSTNTINLQEQLIHKDIPFIRESLGLDFSAVLMKGRGNYLCLRKAHELKRETVRREGADDNAWELDVLFEWMERTADGSRSDLNFMPDNETWELVCCEADNCTRARCRHFSRCFFYQARRQAAKAHLIVTNHHLLMADMAVKEQTGRQSTGILPAFHKLVLDEAHHLEDVATSYLGMFLSPHSFYRNLGRLQNVRKPDRGLVPRLGDELYRLMNAGNQGLIAAIHRHIEESFTPARRACQETLEEIFRRLVQGILAAEERTLAAGEEYKRRIAPGVERTPLWTEAVCPAAEAIAAAVAPFVECAQALLKQVYDLDADTREAIEGTVLDIEALVLRLRMHVASLEGFLEDKEDECRWIEIRKRRQAYQVALRQAPLDVARRLKEVLFDSYESVVLTSATLAINRSFDFIKGRTGLGLIDPERLVEDILDSPYDYANRVLLGMATDMPDPGAPAFAAALAELIRQAVGVTGGNTFVLFTAYGLLTKVFNALEGPLQLEGYTCLRQGQMNRHRLLEEFKKGQRTVLFATDSFWEGVDVKGESLQNVILTKLPFQVPTEPIVEARVERIQHQGGQPFFEYTVPHAIIKFKQGFGRLIRSRDDWGLVLIADRRVMTKSYGRLFLNSLPHCRNRALEREALVAEMRRFRAGFVTE